MRLYAFVFAATLVIGSAHAGPIDLGSMMGGANIYALNNFTARSSDVEGAVIAGGNVDVSGYAINEHKKAAFKDYAVVAGGDIKLQNGSIKHGKMYAGGKVSLESASAPSRSTENPIDFEAAASYYHGLSTDLAKLDSTGSISKLSTGVKVSGSGLGGVDVFNVSADMFRYSDTWNLSNLVAGQTLIFNVSGADVTFNNGNVGFSPLAPYNVLFNFPDAVTLNVKDIIGSILAPNATVSADWGVVNGQVVVKNWNSTVQVNANHYFNTTELTGFRDPLPPVIVEPDNPIVVDPPVIGEEPAEVPEPGTLALMLAGAGIFVALHRRRKAPAAPLLAAA